MFEVGPPFRYDGTGVIPPNIDIVPVRYEPTEGQPTPCNAIHGTQECTNRYHPLQRDIADALMHAIDSSNLAVTLLRGTGDEIFVEGAAQIVGVNPTSWIENNIVTVQRGVVPYGRIINNTIVGLGGTLPSNNLFNEFDYQDVGIRIEHNADPTLMNNVIVNFEEGISTDLSSTTVVLGGTLFQGNVKDTRNIDQGDFSLLVPDDVQLFVDRERGIFYPAADSPAIDSSLDSLEDRPAYVTIKAPMGISPSPILAPNFDVLGQLRADDPRVEPPSGVGQNVFKDRGAIDRVDFSGPRSQLVQPEDNDREGIDQNPEEDRVRIEGANLQEFVIKLQDIGEAGTPTGTGIDDDLVTSDTVTVLRDGVPLVEGVDYRFNYQETNDEIRLTPQAGVWLTGYTYEIRLANTDQFVISPTSADLIPDGEAFTITDETGRSVIFEFESGYTLNVPLPLGLLVPPGTAALSDVADRDLFTLSNGVRLVTFEFDSNNSISPGRIRVPFTVSDTPEMVAGSIVAAIDMAQLGLEPESLGDGVVHIGGPFNTQLDTALSSLVPLGTAGAILDGENFSIQNAQRIVSFEFDDDGDTNLGNVIIPFNSNDTQDELSDALATAISGTLLNLNAVNGGDGRVNLGGTPDVVVRVENTSLTVVGQPGLQSVPGARQLVPIVYVPSTELDSADVSELIQEAVENSSLTGVTAAVNESGQLIVQGADDVQVQGVISLEDVLGIRDLAGNLLQTNQDAAPFDVRYYIELPAPLDFGDTPDLPYATLLTSDGPRHVLVPNIYLGQGVDDELDANTDPNADGDLFDDGVQFGGPVTPTGRVSIEISANTQGFVDAWIDFNGDGVFHPTQERILASAAVQRGANSLDVTVPADAVVGTTFSRFRFSTIGSLQPTGRADNGEVEDYQIEIVSIPAPIARDDQYELDEDTTLTVPVAEGVLVNDENPGTGDLMAIVVSGPEHGSLTLNLDGSFEYIPDPDYFGTDTFTYRAETEILPSNLAVVTLTVIGVPDPPVAGDDYAETDEDTPVLIDLVANDYDPDGALDRSSIEIVEPPANGEVVLDGNGKALYTPDPNYFGTDEFRYTIKDMEGAVSNVATVTIVVHPVNDPPVAVDDFYSTLQGRVGQIDVIENDYDVDGFINPASVVITLNPKGGAVQVNNDGTVTFVPSPGFLGADTFRYTVRDNEGALSNQAVVTVNVVDQNLPPIAEDDEATTAPGEPVRIDLVSNDSDPDGIIIPGSVTIVQDPTAGSVENHFDGTVTYTPNDGFIGTDVFTYTVRDDFNDVSNVATVTVTVEFAGPPWQNWDDPLDVNRDGVVVPLDALLIINEINNRQISDPETGLLPNPPVPPNTPDEVGYFDTDGDGFVSPLDALLVINYLNTPQPAAAVAAVPAAVERQATWNDAHVIGAALDIEPRFQPSATKQEAVDRILLDPNATLADERRARGRAHVCGQRMCSGRTDLSMKTSTGKSSWKKTCWIW